MKVKDNYSKRDYTKKIYWSGDKKDWFSFFISSANFGNTNANSA